MMTRPIQTFENLTSETAGGNGYAEFGFAHADRQRLEREARFARAVFLIDATLWVARQIGRLVAADPAAATQARSPRHVHPGVAGPSL